MDISHHVEELQRQLLTAASAGTPQTEEIAGRLAAALDAAGRLAILEALSEAAGEITRELAPGSVDVRLRGRDVDFVVAAAPGAASADPDSDQDPPLSAPTAKGTQPGEADDGSMSRTTLRLPEGLKARAEDAAALEGVSLNTWLVRAVITALEPRTPTRQTHGASYTGWLR